MKDRIGKFEGMPVYATTAPAYIMKKYYNDNSAIYLIGDSLIRSNEVFARYDGKEVHEIDLHERYRFYNPEEKEKRTNTPATPEITVSYPNPNKTPILTKSAEEILQGVYIWQL